MCQLLETILVKGGRLQNLYWHNARINTSRHALFQLNDPWDLARLITLPVLDHGQIYRCRLLYSRNIDHIEFIPYSPRSIRKLYLVRTSGLDYAFKYADRTVLDNLKSAMVKESDADILIIANEMITDTSFSNIVFYDGKNWITPDLPLLKGTRRAMYLEHGLIREERIRVEDLRRYQQARLINAMLDIDSGDAIKMVNIIG